MTCITEYKEWIEGGVSYYCETLTEDFDGDKKKAYDYAKKHATWEEIPYHIVGNPDEDPKLAELYTAILKEAERQFSANLFGTY